jgi:starvation-inducible DNA-binding protein
MLKDDLKTVLGTTFAFYVKTAGFHWNVEGPDFPQYHDFLGNLYEEVYSSIDKMAELIRQLDSYAPGALSRYIELSAIEEQTQIPRAELMIAELLRDNEILIDCLNAAFASATAENKQGICDFIAGRLDAHEKHGWMLRGILKRERA